MLVFMSAIPATIDCVDALRLLCVTYELGE